MCGRTGTVEFDSDKGAWGKGSSSDVADLSSDSSPLDGTPDGERTARVGDLVHLPISHSHSHVVKTVARAQQQPTKWEMMSTIDFDYSPSRAIARKKSVAE